MAMPLAPSTSHTPLQLAVILLHFPQIVLFFANNHRNPELFHLRAGILRFPIWVAALMTRHSIHFVVSLTNDHAITIIVLKRLGVHLNALCLVFKRFFL